MQINLTVILILLLPLTVFCQSNEGVFKDSIVISNNTTLIVVGHRGGFDTLLPENSIALFEHTYEKSCSKPIAIEFDIRESASGSLFVMHDTTVDRTTNGKGEIRLLSDSYLETLFLKDKNGNLTTEKIPLFREVLQRFQDKNIILMLDVKGNIWEKVITLVKQINMESKCIALTFNQQTTKFVFKNCDKLMVSALVKDSIDWKSLLELNLPGERLIAYVNIDSPAELIKEINSYKVRLMTDMSETSKNSSKYFSQDYYKSLASSMHLGILISDFPLYVNKLFCNEE